jgi:hypothetical protein
MQALSGLLARPILRGKIAPWFLWKICYPYQFEYKEVDLSCSFFYPNYALLTIKLKTNYA